MEFINKNKDHFKYGINQWNGEPNKPVFYNKEMAKAVRGIKACYQSSNGYCKVSRFFMLKAL